MVVVREGKLDAGSVVFCGQCYEGQCYGVFEVSGIFGVSDIFEVSGIFEVSSM